MTVGSFVRFGWYFARQILLRMLGRRRGLAAFREAYGGDRLLPLGADDRRALPSFSGCIACGMCDATFDAYPRVARAELRGPSDLPLAYSRNLPDYDALPAFLDQLDKGDLERLERVCPGHVPFRALSEFARSQADQLATLRPKLPAPAPRAKHDPG